MGNINQYSDFNVGGIVDEVEIISIVNVDNILKPNSNRIVSVQLKAGKSWDVFKMTSLKGTYDSQEQLSTAGSSFGNKVTFPIAKVRYDASVVLNAMVNNRYLVKVTLLNGIKILLGSLESPMMKTHSVKIEDLPSGFNGYNITMEGKSEKEPYFV